MKRGGATGFTFDAGLHPYVEVPDRANEGLSIPVAMVTIEFARWSPWATADFPNASDTDDRRRCSGCCGGCGCIRNRIAFFFFAQREGKINENSQD